uniref:Mediator of DNA damage checkpoint protein 1 n=1 Tax=Nothobranchius furzeri TaxID=105023 RepID=A0A8C6KGC9_NOTFU
GMDATQAISDAILESEEEENEENENRRGSPLAKLCILKNPHVPEAELPLFLGDNVLGRDPSLCTLPMAASSVSKQHATICISVYRRRGARCDVDMEALVWDLGSMNGTRKGRLKLTPNVRYALSEGDSLVLADIPCQYVRWGGVSSQDDMKIPGCVLSGVKGTFPDAPGGKQGDTDRGSKRGVNSGAKATKTPVRGSFLSFEQTPTQPKGCLVPDSDSDSDGERDGGGIGHQKTRGMSVNMIKCQLTLYILFEIEDESPVTLSFSSQPSRHVSFNTEKSDVCVERNRSPNDETDGKGGTASKDSGQNQNGESNVTFREDESLVSTPEVSREAIPDFNMDSDTDVEAEEEGVPAEPLSFNTSQRADQRSDEPSEAHSDETTKPAHVASGIQPEDIIIDSDTDDDDDDVSDAVIKASSFQDAHTADAASSVQLKDFHLDSDTDVEEEIKSNLNPAAAAGDPSVAAATAESSSPAAAGPDLDILSDSDTDMEEDCLLVKPLVTEDPSEVSGKAPGALESDSDEDTDVDEPCVTHAGDSPAELRVDGDASAEDQEEDAEEAGEDHIPHLPLVPTLQNYSTPSETKVCVNLALEATQAYVSDSCDDSDEDKRQDAAPTETTELTDHSSALATAETQPVPSFEEESLEIRNPVCSVQSVETKERDPAQPREKHLFEAETQPMCMTDTEEGDDEDSTAPLQLQEDPTEPQTCSPSALAETQPMHVDEGENDDDSVPLKAKRLSVEEEESQRLGGSDAYVAETQPVFVSEDDDEGDWGPRRREAKPPQLEEEQTRPQISSDLHIEDESQQLLSSAETQPTRGEDVEAGPQGGEAMPLQRDEGQINPSTEVAGVDKHDHKDAVTAKQHDLKETTVSAEADPPSVSNSRQTRARLRGKEDADGSASTKRRTRQESKTLPSTRGSRGKAVTQSEEDVKQCKQARGRKNTRRQEDEEDDNKIIAAKEAIKGQKEGNLEQDEKESERMHASVTKEKQEWVEQERRNQGELKNKEKASAERLQGGELEESEGKRDEEEKLNVSARPRRSARKTAPCAAGPEQPSTISTREDFAARRTRSHSNSSNSVSSERSASSVSAQESRGRGRGEKRSSEALQTPVTRSSRRRTTATVAPIEKGREAVRSEISTCSESPQNRARGCRQRGKGRKTVSDLQNSTERVGKTGRAEELSSEVLPMGDEDKGDAQQPATSRGQQRVGTNAKDLPNATKASLFVLPSSQVLFTGVVDEGGERELARLGGGMAKGVADMNCLVTDKVRRTVKFLCAVAKGVPVVTTDWLEKSGKAGSFLPTDVFVVKDPEQEKKFSFCLQESLRTARSRRLLQGYEIHVTKSVKPEPVHMKDILSCSGATFLSKMPSSHKPQTVVISCEEDWRLCGPAVSASLPVVSTEFILTGILQQKLDFHTHALSPSSAANSQPAGDRGRTRRKT